MKTRKEIEVAIADLREQLKVAIFVRHKKAINSKIEINNKYLLILDNFNKEQLEIELQKNKENKLIKYLLL